MLNMLLPKPREMNERKGDKETEDKIDNVSLATEKAHAMLLSAAAEVTSLASEVASKMNKENQTPTLQCQIIESIIFTDYEGRILEYNESAEDLFCRNKGCLKDRNIKQFIPNLEDLQHKFSNVKTFSATAKDCQERAFTISISFNKLSNQILYVIQEFK